MEASDHRHVTHENKGANEQRNENKAYVPMGDAKYTAQQVLEMEANKEGKYDEDGFFVLPNGDFIDPYGYYFDEEGYDNFGGYYDDDGYYVPGEEYHDEYYEKLRDWLHLQSMCTQPFNG
ncbi:UNKNOWN [Stylonychia lemnae]|uniref:Uncharacterized protein n=1 Tax=Stylonychia lemnae TaxID=5949 RepID=A0A078ASI9_STYLE|nr:UNKNOWN [Stylonychia lemnae]|eukprot:CDW85420.1 UNKNOWN [Stylonychia lemnae]